jgi:hypothetical protein
MRSLFLSNSNNISLHIISEYNAVPYHGTPCLPEGYGVTLPSVTIVVFVRILAKYIAYIAVCMLECFKKGTQEIKEKKCDTKRKCNR